MSKYLIGFCLLAGLSFGHTAEPAGPPPSEVDPGIAAALQKDGIRIKDGDKVVMELWFRTTKPTGPASTDASVTLKQVPQGSLMGVLRFPARGADRRGQTIKPGVYTLRLSFFPPNGDHQGVAPQRDFLLLSPAATDKDLKAAPAFDALVEMSRKASGTPHPAVLSIWKVEEKDFKPGVAQEGDTDWVLQTKIGDTPIAVIVAGVFNH